MTQSAITVAEYMLCHNQYALTSLHLNKLVFLSHGWNLGLRGKPLISEQIQAWKLGPVIPSLYHAYKTYGEGAIEPREHLGAGTDGSKFNQIKDALFTRLDNEERCIIDQVLEHYGDWPAWDLVNLTHENNTPWDKYYDPDEYYTVIPDYEIEKYYQRIKNE